MTSSVRAQFPRLYAALAHASTGRNPYPEARLARLDAAIEGLLAGKPGEIENARFLEFKDTLNRAFDAAWEKLPARPTDFYERNRAREFSEAVFEEMSPYSRPTLSNWATRIKRLTKLQGEDPMVVAGLALVQEFKPLVDQHAALKDHTRKRTDKTPEERAAEKYTPPVSTSQAVAVVKGLLEQVMDESYKELLSQFQRHYRTQFELFSSKLEHIDDHPEDLPVDRYGRAGGRVKYLRPEHVFGTVLPDGRILHQDILTVQHMHHAFKMGERPNGQPGFVALPDAVQILDRIATQEVMDIRRLFVVKNLKKLVSILEGKETHGHALVDAKALGRSVHFNRMEGSFAFTFDDQSSFEVRNAVVRATNDHGTSYLRYPLTFHKVRLPNGKALTQPSEKAMNEWFVKAKPEPEAPEPMSSSEALVRPRRLKM